MASGGNKKVDLKVVLLGRAAVGKSSLVERFLHDRWSNDSSPTVGAAFGARTIPISNNQSLTLGVWDTAGSERYESMTRHYYKGADGAVICYDLTDAESWEKVKFWIKEIQAVEENCILTVVGCKSDMLSNGKHKRAIPKETVSAYCNQINAKHYETSALSGAGVAQPFTEIAQQFNLKPKRQNNQEQVVNLNDSGSSKKGGCC